MGNNWGAIRVVARSRTLPELERVNLSSKHIKMSSPAGGEKRDRGSEGRGEWDGGEVR